MVMQVTMGLLCNFSPFIKRGLNEIQGGKLNGSNIS